MLGYYRLLLAFGVLLSHAGLLSVGLAGSMVGCFYAVSGFLMMLTLDRNYGANPLPYYWNRILRVYPLYWAAALAVLLLGPYFGFDASERYNSAGQLISVLLLNFNGTDVQLVAPAWTLPYELAFYVFAPVVFRSGGLGSAILLAGFVVGSCWLYGLRAFGPFAVLIPQDDIHNPSLHPFGYGEAALGNLLTSGIVFSLGACVYFFKRWLDGRAPAGRRTEIAALVLVAACFVLQSRFRLGDAGMNDRDLVGNLLLNGACLLATVAMLLGWRGRDGARSQLAGDLSYPVYILHHPLLHIFVSRPLLSAVEAVLRPLGPFAGFIAGAFIAAVVSVALGRLWIAFDNKFIHRLKRRSRRAHAT